MTALVTKHLPLVAGAPDGIERLRTLILDVAIQGLLTSQAGSGFADEFTQPSVGETVPFRLPPRWHWSTVGDECVLENGDRSSNYPNKSCLVPSGVPFINAGHLNAGRIDLDEMTFISRDRFDMLRSGKVKQGDLLYCLRGSLGKVALVDGIEKGAIASSLVIVRPGSVVIPRYLLVYFNTSLVAKQISTYDNGTAQPNLAAGSLRKFVLPVPSPEEQHRIVAKVDELMALCDRLEADQAEAEAAHARLVQALLDSLTQATDAADFRASWQRLSEHFHTLFTTEASIDFLRKTILHLAADGRLLTSNGSVDVRAIGDVLDGNTLNGCSYKPTDEPRGTPILRISAGTGHDDFYVDESDHKWIELTESERAKFCLEPEDLLACRFNGNLHYVGSFSLYRGLSNVAQAFPDKLIRFRANRELVLPSYLRLVMNAKPAREQIESFCATTVGNIGISASNLKTIKLRIPSLTEQHCIVDKVDELMALCDQLKSQLAEARQQHAQLATVLVEQAVA